jgi:phosphate uptake regulator
MKRKIIQLAKNTLVVSLPTEYIKHQGLEKGDELDTEIEGHKFILTPQGKIGEEEAEISVKNMTERSLRWHISSLHKQGYDQITIREYTEQQYRILEELINNLFVGFMIKEKTTLRVIVGQVAVVAADEFNRTLRQAFRHMNTMFEDFIKALEKQDNNLLAYQQQHEQTNNKLTNFCERLLNKTLHQKQKGHFWYVIAWNLEKIADNFKYLMDLDIATVTEEDIALVKKVHKFYNDYYTCFYSFSIETLAQLSSHKKEIEQELLTNIQNTNSQAKLLYHYLHMMLLQIADFSASMIALQDI